MSSFSLTLVINNSESQLLNINLEQYRELKKILRYSKSIQSTYYLTQYPRYQYLIDAKGRFPTGLLYLVQNYLIKKALNFKITDLRKRPESIIGLYNFSLRVTPYPEQIEAARACRTRYRGIVSATTGTGKSLIAAMIINELQVPTLVVVPSLELKRQLTQTLKELFGTEKVGTLKDRRSIVVENVDSLPLTPIEGYGALIIDEFHHSGAATYRKLNKKAWGNIFYRFGLTATPFRSQETERLLLESVLSEVIYTLDYQTSVSKGYIVPVEAYYIEIPKKKPKGIKWPAVYSELVVHNTYRNEVISTILLNLQQNNISALCLVKEIQHGENLVKLTNLPFIKGENDDNRIKILEFNLKETPVVIGTTGVIGEGVDTKPCEYVIIAGLGKSKNQFMQCVGRGLRKYPDKNSCKIILIKDTSHKWTLSHYKAQVKILQEEYGVQPVKLEI